jgi:hypothetical protein
MKEKFQEELGNKNYFVMKYGYVIILIVTALILFSFLLIKIDNKVLFQMIKEYYFR